LPISRYKLDITYKEYFLNLQESNHIYLKMEIALALKKAALIPM